MLRLVNRVSASIRARASAFLEKRRRRLPEMVGRADEFELKRAFQVDFLEQHGLTSETSLVDIGCGILRGGLPLIRRLGPGRYCGIDVRAECIKEATRVVRQAGLTAKQPQLIHAEDIGQLELLDRFDVAWAFSVLFHLTDESLDSVFLFVAKHLSNSGVFYANVNIGSAPDGTWLDFPVRWRSLDQYQQVGYRHGLKVAHLGTLEQFGHRSEKESRENLQAMLAFRKFVSSARQ